MKKYWLCPKCGTKTAYELPETYRQVKPDTFRSVVYCKCGQRMRLQESEPDTERPASVEGNRAHAWLALIGLVVFLVAIYHGLSTLIEENDDEPIITIGGLLISVLFYGLIATAWDKFSLFERIGLILSSLPLLLIILFSLWFLLT